MNNITVTHKHLMNHALVESVESISIFAVGDEKQMIRKGAKMLRDFGYPNHMIQDFKEERSLITSDTPAYVLQVVKMPKIPHNRRKSSDIEI